MERLRGYTEQMMRALAFALFFLAGVAGPAAEESLEVPDGEGAWAMNITTSGGFKGQGRGEARVTSEGRLFCQKTIVPCIKDIAPEKLGPLKIQVAAFDLKKSWKSDTNPPKENRVVPSCADCYVTQVIFARREKRKVKIFTIAWDDSTRGSAPADIVRIAEMALTGKW